MPSATATLSEFLRPNQPEIVRGERRLARGCPWSKPVVGPRHGSRTTASQRASSSGARPCLIPGHLGSSRLISRPTGRRSRVGRGAANLRESLKRRLRGHFGEEQRRPGPTTPAPRRSLPSSSAHPAGGGGKANSCAYGAPATVSTATTGTPAARSSSIALSARRRLSRFTAVREEADR